MDVKTLLHSVPVGKIVFVSLRPFFFSSFLLFLSVCDDVLLGSR